MQCRSGNDVGMAEPTEIIASEPGRTAKAPTDVLRLAVSVTALLIVVVIGAFFDDAIVGFVSDLLRGLEALPTWLVTGVVVLGQILGVVVIVGGAALAIIRRRWFLLVVTAAAAAAAVAMTLLILPLVDHVAPQAAEVDESYTLVDPDEVVSTVGLAMVAAIVTAAAPWVSRRWRRAGWTLVIIMALTRLLGAPVEFDTLVAVLAGWIAGAAVIVLLGAPSRRPTGASIAEGLAAVGVPLARLEQASLDARGSTPYFATGRDGSALFVKVLGDDERSADLLFRVYRRLQPRDLGDEKAFSSLRRAVEHEALVALAARDIGIRTPRLVAFATAKPNGFVLAYEAIAGRSLDRLAPEEMTDEVLAGVWEEFALMRSHRIAHRDLRLANVFLADDGAAWIIDFGFSELAASDQLLATDLAELLASSTTQVGRRACGGGGARRGGARHPRDGARPAAAPHAERRHPHRHEGRSQSALRAPPARRVRRRLTEPSRRPDLKRQGFCAGLVREQQEGWFVGEFDWSARVATRGCAHRHLGRRPGGGAGGGAADEGRAHPLRDQWSPRGACRRRGGVRLRLRGRVALHRRPLGLVGPIAASKRVGLAHQEASPAAGYPHPTQGPFSRAAIRVRPRSGG